MKLIKYILIQLFIIISCISALYPISINQADYSKYISSEKYITDQEGNILIQINVWGHVKNPGHHIVYDGIDLITLLAAVGGPLSGANLKQITLIREEKDDNGKIIYELDLNKFYKSGSRSELVEILPNDTIIIEQTLFSTIFMSSNALITILQILNLMQK